MTNYNDGKWHGWAGSQVSPVHGLTSVDVLFDDGSCLGVSHTSQSIKWSHIGKGLKIVAFCVTKEYKEPREYWLWPNIHGYRAKSALAAPFEGAIHVREVVE